MFQCASIYTCEVDDPYAAFDEINAQLKEKITLLENTVGVVMCHAEFVASGVLGHILKSLPFDVAGVTTPSQAVNCAVGELILTIFIITSDDAFFRAGMTESVRESVRAPLEEAYQKTSAGILTAPKLILAFPPFVGKSSGDDYVAEWGRIVPGAPVFGTMSSDDTTDFCETSVVLNDKASEDSMAFILCYGNINPRFAIATLSGDDRTPYRGEITKADGSRVLEINNVSAIKYFKDIGIIKDGQAMPTFYLLPFLIHQKKLDDYDGVPVLRGLHAFTDDGAASFRGYVGEHSTFSMLQWNAADIISSTRQKLAEIAALDEVNGVLAFPCTIRRMILMPVDSMAELNISRETLGEIPFMLGYAGGEICPTSVKNGVHVNRFHNFSLIVLIL